MKKLIFTLLLINYLGTGTFVFAQFNQSSPQTFQTHLSNGAYCPSLDYRGSIHFNTQTNKLVFCTGINSFQSGSSSWNNATGGISYSSGNIGIGVASPTFDLEMGSNTTTRFANNLLITDKLGINTNMPNEKLEILNSNLSIRNIEDNISWRQIYFSGFPNFSIDRSVNNGYLLVFQCQSGLGIVNIGGVQAPSSKLAVNGAGNFIGNVTSENKGLLQNSTSTQLKFYVFTVNPPNNLVILSNSCATIDFDLPPNGFNSPPTISFSKKINDGLTDDGIIISIEGVTASTGRLRFCNTSTTHRTISKNEYYNVISFGEGN